MRCCSPSYLHRRGARRGAGGRVSLHHEDDVALESTALADRIDELVRARLDVHAAERDPQQPRQVGAHPRLDLPARVLHVDSRLLADDRHVDIPHAVSSPNHALVRLLHEHLRVGTFKPRVVVRKELPYVRHRERAEDRVRHRVVHDVTVRVRHAAEIEIWRVGAVEFDAADDDGLTGLLARRHSVDVVPVANAQQRLSRGLQHGRTCTAAAQAGRAGREHGWRTVRREAGRGGRHGETSQEESSEHGR
mmetsp:Transcript_38697/g.121941  ORF Transcript_38697/g.121941 Transcript_38697/m.121941 type:complete len:249 (+) Transcript_38697:69-815(+)